MGVPVDWKPERAIQAKIRDRKARDCSLKTLHVHPPNAGWIDLTIILWKHGTRTTQDARTIAISVLTEIRDFLIAILLVVFLFFSATSSFRSCFYVWMPIHGPNSLIKFSLPLKKSLLCSFTLFFVCELWFKFFVKHCIENNKSIIITS